MEGGCRAPTSTNRKAKGKRSTTTSVNPKVLVKCRITKQATMLGLKPLSHSRAKQKDARQECQDYRRDPVTLDVEKITKHSNLPQHRAAECLGVSVSTLKRACNRLGMQKWPYNRHAKPVTDELGHRLGGQSDHLRREDSGQQLMELATAATHASMDAEFVGNSSFDHLFKAPMDQSLTNKSLMKQPLVSQRPMADPPLPPGPPPVAQPSLMRATTGLREARVEQSMAQQSMAQQFMAQRSVAQQSTVQQSIEIPYILQESMGMPMIQQSRVGPMGLQNTTASLGSSTAIHATANMTCLFTERSLGATVEVDERAKLLKQEEDLRAQLEINRQQQLTLKMTEPVRPSLSETTGGSSVKAYRSTAQMQVQYDLPHATPPIFRPNHISSVSPLLESLSPNLTGLISLNCIPTPWSGEDILRGRSTDIGLEAGMRENSANLFDDEETDSFARFSLRNRNESVFEKH